MDDVHAAFSEVGSEFPDCSVEWLANPAWCAHFAERGRSFRRWARCEYEVCIDDEGSTRAMSYFWVKEATKVWHHHR